MRNPLTVRFLLLCGCLLCVAGIASALDTGRMLGQFSYRTFSTADGLPQSSVYSIAETADGYLWLATQRGLVRFDGVRFTVFKQATVETFPHNWVSSILPAENGLLLGTVGGGIVRMAKGQSESLPPGDLLPNGLSSSLFEDREGGSLGRDGRGGPRPDSRDTVHSPDDPGRAFWPGRTAIPDTVSRACQITLDAVPGTF